MEALALTLTIKPKFYSKDLAEQYTLVKEELKQCPFNKSLVTEITKSGNLHFHGVINVPTVGLRGTAKQAVHNYFKKCKVIGFIYVKEMTDRKGWYSYCFKELDKTKLDVYFAPTIIVDECIDFPKGLEIIQLQCDLQNKKIKMTDLNDIDP